MQKQKRLIVVAGPTASGKTALAIALAKELRTEIVSADSRQFYREIPIGTAQPSEEELATVPHHFIASHSIETPINAGSYERLALEKIKRLFEKYDNIVLVGGSGLYIKALVEGMDELPPVTPLMRLEVREIFEREGLQGLQEALKNLDSQYFASVDAQNPVRLMRALEIIKSSGRTYSEYLGKTTSVRPFQTLAFWIDLPREQLYARINYRAEQMLEQGWIAEAVAVEHLKHLQALQTLGYREIYDYRSGVILNREMLLPLIQQHTRQYAKRQVTWFRNQGQYQTVENLHQILEKL